MTKPLVLPAHQIDRASRVGGKAASLAAMTQAGLPIPDWFAVLPAAFEASVPAATASTLGQAATAQAAQALLRDVRLSDDTLDQIAGALERIATQDDLLAIRSSAGEEDSARLSFAGQLDSFLRVPVAQVAARVIDVWRSAYGDRLLRYRREAGLGPLAGIPAVVVQRMVEGEVSGVAFSADPVSGRRGIAVVAAVRGLGDALVSGEKTGDTWHIDRAGGVVDRTPGEGAAHAVMDDACATEVAALARRAEALFGRPQDIEWTLRGGKLWLLQSRPITTLADRADPDAPRMLWDNSNIIESYSGVTTPLTFSFARHAYQHVYGEFCRLMRISAAEIEANSALFAGMLGLFGGRVYYNLLNWYRMIALGPVAAANRRYLDQMLGVSDGGRQSPFAPAANEGRAAALRRRVRFGAMLVYGVVQLLTLPRRIDRFYARLRAALGERRPDLSGWRPDELVACYRSLERQLLAHWDAPVVNDLGTMIYHGMLRRLCTAWVGDAAGTLSNDLLLAEHGVISEEPARRVQDMARLASGDPALVRGLCEADLPGARAALRTVPALDRALADYLERFGDRCMEELKLESLTLHDDPLPLLRAIGQFARTLGPGGTPVREPGTTALQAAHARVRDALGGRPLRRTAFAWVLRRARACMRARENLRFERTRVFGRVRQIFVELGRRLAALDRLDDARDVFYLEHDELLGTVEGWATTADLKALAAVRKAEYARYRVSPAPPDRFETHGLLPVGPLLAAPPAVAATGSTLRGQGCCAGVVRGPVRVVRDPRQASVRPGEIVVAERTDPGWVMIFPSASGLLVERGSLLSHSAIVARELGLPAIVSIAGLTSWVSDGEWVEMDGSSGTVVKVEAPHA
ncbi:MAG: PEP/pyruvate-binding domain-containing protein [Sphingomonadaceae bacterium]